MKQKKARARRRPLDAYFTPAWQVRGLLDNQPGIQGIILEPCSGDGSISQTISTDAVGIGRAHRDSHRSCIVTNDIDPAMLAQFHLDAADPELYLQVIEKYGGVDWVVTNPPYKMPLCTQIVEQALKHARIGVAMLLRISFREPTAHKNPRGPFLEANPVSRLLTLPRYSYTGNGKSDSATTEWAIWLKDKSLGKDLRPIDSLYRADEIYSHPLPLCA